MLLHTLINNIFPQISSQERQEDFIASCDETQKQYEAAEYIISEVKKYIGGKNYD
jgi:hypothetical protein